MHFTAEQQLCPYCGYAEETNIEQGSMGFNGQSGGNTYTMPQTSVPNTGSEYQYQQPAQQYTPDPYQQQNMNNYPGQQYGQPPVPQYYPPMGLMKKSEFIKIPAMEKIRQIWKVTWIGLYVVVVFNLLMLLILEQPYLLVDVILILGLNLGIHLGFNRGCAVAVFAYAVFNVCYMLYAEGQLGGVLILLFGALAIRSTRAFHKAWNNYTSTGIIPTYVYNSKGE